jgi:hypothetical protein
VKRYCSIFSRDEILLNKYCKKVLRVFWKLTINLCLRYGIREIYVSDMGLETRIKLTKTPENLSVYRVKFDKL